MKHPLFAALPILALLGAGCAMPDGTPIVLPTSPEPSAAENTCPQTPQVYFFNKLAFSAREISDIQTNVVTPLIAYYEGLPEYKVVSIMIKRTATGINVEAIVDQTESDDPIYHGFVHPRADGGYPMWYPEEVPPEYRG